MAITHFNSFIDNGKTPVEIVEKGMGYRKSYKVVDFSIDDDAVKFVVEDVGKRKDIVIDGFQYEDDFWDSRTIMVECAEYECCDKEYEIIFKDGEGDDKMNEKISKEEIERRKAICEKCPFYNKETDSCRVDEHSPEVLAPYLYFEWCDRWKKGGDER